MRVLTGALLACAVLATLSGQALACTAEDFGKAVDEAGQLLRSYNGEAAPALNRRLRQLGQKRGWKESEIEERALAELSDDKLAGFDATANELLDKIDTLGRVAPGGELDCAKLDEMKAAGLELLAVMKAKTAYTVAKIDGELARPAGEPVVADGSAGDKTADNGSAKPTEKPVDKAAEKVTAAAPKVPAPPAQPAAPATAPAPAVAGHAAAAPPQSPVPDKPKPPSRNWTTTTEQVASAESPVPTSPPSASGAPAGPQASPTPALPPGALLPTDDGYTIDEIKDISRGFFGNISTGLAGVIEHAFSQSGRPTAYVLGSEGGGAFLAGLRYGDGTLYLRSGGTRKVHWHGPSLGYDFGAAGSRTLFLIYGLHDPNAIFRHFTGIDGSAYVIGGVGITYLQGGGVIMAPIRSGLGLRVGASVGYVRFTAEPSWNPF